MKITFLGSGDAFGSGGRFQPCILMETSHNKILLDCGCSTSIAMRKFNINPNEIAAILITHLHGDHFGGIPFFLLDAQMVSKRTAPLIIAGPAGTRQRITDLMEVMFPGSSKTQQKYSVEIKELHAESSEQITGIDVTAFVVSHFSGSPSTALRLKAEGKIITYTGDTEWTENLVPAAKDADLMIAEAYYYDKKIKFHLDYKTLAEQFGNLQAKRLILTHMSENMLANLAGVFCDYAFDGKVVEV